MTKVYGLVWRRFENRAEVVVANNEERDAARALAKQHGMQWSGTSLVREPFEAGKFVKGCYRMHFTTKP